MRSILIFIAGCFFGGIVGVFATCLCVSAGCTKDDDAEYKRYLAGVGDPRD